MCRPSFKLCINIRPIAYTRDVNETTNVPDSGWPVLLAGNCVTGGYRYRPVVGCRYSANGRNRSTAAGDNTSGPYIRAWLIQVSRHVGHLHQHCRRLRTCRLRTGVIRGPFVYLYHCLTNTSVRARQTYTSTLTRGYGPWSTGVKILVPYRYRPAFVNNTGRKSPTGTPLNETLYDETETLMPRDVRNRDVQVTRPKRSNKEYVTSFFAFYSVGLVKKVKH